MRLLTNVILCGLFLFSCNSAKYTTPTGYPDNTISFGSGGGFTGFVTEYTILDNGQVFKKMSNESEYTVLEKLKKNQVTQLFESAKTLDLESIKFSHTGNMNSFVKVKTAAASYEINWGSPGPEPPKNAKLYYNILMNLIKKTQS